MADKTPDFELKFDANSKQPTWGADSATKQVAADLKEALTTIEGGNAALRSFFNILKESKEKGIEVDAVMKGIAEANTTILSKTQPFLDYLKKAIDEGVDLRDAMKEVGSVIRETSKDMDDLQQALASSKSVLTAFSTDSDKLGKAFIEIGKQSVDFVGTMLSGAPPMAKILDIALKIGLALNEIDKVNAELNRTSYDVSANMGVTGEKSQETSYIIGDLKEKFKFSTEESSKLVLSISTLTKNMEEVATISEQVAVRFTNMSSLTPEFQIKTMHDMMKNFGGSIVDANKRFETLYEIATKLKGTVGGIDIKDFMSQAHQVSISMAGWGYSLGDSQKTLASMALSIASLTGGKSGVDLVRTAEIATAMSTYGLTSLAQMSYMAETYGKGDKLKGEEGLAMQLGTVGFLSSEKGGSKELRGMQGSMAKEMIETAIGQKIITGPGGTSKEEIMGGLLIAQEEGMAPKMGMEANRKFSELMAAGKFDEAYVFQQKEGKAIANAGVDTAKNTKDALTIAKESHGTLVNIWSTLTGAYFKRGSFDPSLSEGDVTMDYFKKPDVMSTQLKSWLDVDKTAKKKGMELSDFVKSEIQKTIKQAQQEGASPESEAIIKQFGAEGFDVEVHIKPKDKPTLKKSTVKRGNVITDNSHPTSP